MQNMQMVQEHPGTSIIQQSLRETELSQHSSYSSPDTRSILFRNLPSVRLRDTIFRSSIFRDVLVPAATMVAEDELALLDEKVQEMILQLLQFPGTRTPFKGSKAYYQYYKRFHRKYRTRYTGLIARIAAHFLSRKSFDQRLATEVLLNAIHNDLFDFVKELLQLKTPIMRQLAFYLFTESVRLDRDSDVTKLCQAGFHRSHLLEPQRQYLLETALEFGSCKAALALVQGGSCSYLMMNRASDWVCETARCGNIELLLYLRDEGFLEDTTINTRALAQAIKAGKIKAIRLLIRNGAALDECYTCEPHKQWAVDRAYQYLDESIFNELYPQSKRAQKKLSMSGILLSADLGTLRLARYLYMHEAHTTAPRYLILRRALRHAAAFGLQPAVESLLKHGVDPNIQNEPNGCDCECWDDLDHSSPVVNAIERDDLEITELLIQHGAEFTAECATVAAPLPRFFHVLESQLSKKPILAQNARSVIQYAVRSQDWKVLDLFTKHGATIKQICQGGVQLAKYAVNSPKMMEYLFEQGLDWNSPPSRKRRFTALHFALCAPDLNLEVIQFLIRTGHQVANFLYVDIPPLLEIPAQRTPSSANWLPVFKLLLRSGADINGFCVRSSPGWNSTLTHLVLSGHGLEVIRLALDAGRM